jgi:hypothetical protein
MYDEVAYIPALFCEGLLNEKITFWTHIQLSVLVIFLRGIYLNISWPIVLPW